MKTHVVVPLIVAALGAALPAALPAQTPAFSQFPAASTNPSTLQTTSNSSDAFLLNRLAGKPVRTGTGEELGTVTDFLLDATSGKIQFAVAPTGRGASGETFRLVPAAAFDASSNQDALVLKISRAQWEQAGTMTEQELPARVSLSAEQVQRAAKQFGIGGQENAGATSNLVRATTLRGQPVRAGNDQIGTIDDVLIDVARQTAAVALKPAANNASANASFIVPFAQLQVGNEGTITTTLGRNDFQSAALSPTGYDSTNQSLAAASAVQQAIANNRALAGTGVQVTSESRLVLRGTVRTAQQRAEIERTATQAAPGVPIDNQIAVRGW